MGSPKERESLLKNNLKDLARMFAKEEEEEEMGAREDKKAGSGRGESNHVKDNNNDNEKTGSKFNPYLVGEPLKRVAKKIPNKLSNVKTKEDAFRQIPYFQTLIFE